MSWRCVFGLSALGLAACGQPANPLLSASDGQFGRLIDPKNAFSPSCAAALYEPELYVKQHNGLRFSAAGKIAAVSEEHKAQCAAELQARAAEAGMGDVTRAHLADDAVRQRYLAMRKG